MKIDWKKIERIMAEKMLRHGDVAERGGVSPGGLSHIKARALAGQELAPASAGAVAKGLGVSIIEIEADQDAA